jgi:hypothetical protein
MRWDLTAVVPAGVAAAIVPLAVVSTTGGLQSFPCAAVVAGASSVACSGTTIRNALQGSTVTVVFAAGVTSTGTVSGPGARPLLPPPPPFALLPPPAPLPVPPAPLAPFSIVAPAPAAPEVPVIPEGDSLLLLALGLATLALLPRPRGGR